jgi:flavin reductase (DIM6/NTAB) family NADH-FMN oxidoreductase RutF
LRVGVSDSDPHLREVAVKNFKKKDFPVSDVRRFIEPGPIVLVSSRWKGETNIMTMGWHMIMEFSPSLIGCYIWDQNHSREMVRKSRECVINVPTYDLIRKVIAIGNSTGGEIDKFEEFSLTPQEGSNVKAPLVKECYANFECRLYDGKLIDKYSLFVWEVVKAHVAVSPRFPRTIHYRGEGRFMVSGKEVNYARYFKPEML